ncbi:N-acetylglucosamine-6-phosphate deacetylase [Desulfosporosinus fructosivorans]|uniref:N-acetylglucosamine-6-phosphate deacetylase n=1 Tax=Desulfosporosinus fructosivorans TaxID=2018669 RepID=A0A4Z0RB24_9FIRM|nr:N-acetylglucosamine-6-phosphate deacetylase [Desulfosporosinus fructosivorans]TGE39634.1 N-acetylglucosamine-6-phosphate deacetylase [Desulfosporosinus fructosivorans]
MDRGLVHGATLVLPDRICSGGMLWQDGILKEIFDEASEIQRSRPEDLKETTVWDMEGDFVIPGLIDTHVHGAGGYDVMDGTPESLHTLAEALLKEGTTAFLPTTMSCSAEQLKKVLHNVADFHRGQLWGAESLGLHLEGPFLAVEFRGAQATELIWEGAKEGSAQFLANLLGEFPDLVKILTFAPERPDGRELAEICAAHGVIPSAGHTAANFDQMGQAVQWGVRHITHAFNAMPGIHHRNPGLLTKALLEETITMEIIADGVHIHPAVIDLVLRNKSPERVCLISDGTRAVGMPDGEYELGGQKTFVRQGMAQLPDGTIAGSAYPLRQGLKTLVQTLEYPLPKAVCYVTLNPAKLLGVDNRIGSLELNKEATFIRLSPDFDIKQVWLQGKLVFEARGI